MMDTDADSNEDAVPLRPEHLRSLRVNAWGRSILTVAVSLSVVAVPLLGDIGSDAPSDATFLIVLSVANAAVLALALLRRRSRRSLRSPLVWENASAAERQVRLERWVELEGAAALGVGVVFLAGLDGLVPDDPIYYANLVSACVMVFVTMTELGTLEEEAKNR